MQAMERRNRLCTVLFLKRAFFVNWLRIFALRQNKHCATRCLFCRNAKIKSKGSNVIGVV